jgi:hypothetical protein
MTVLQRPGEFVVTFPRRYCFTVALLVLKHLLYEGVAAPGRVCGDLPSGIS